MNNDPCRYIPRYIKNTYSLPLFKRGVSLSPMYPDNDNDNDDDDDKIWRDLPNTPHYLLNPILVWRKQLGGGNKLSGLRLTGGNHIKQIMRDIGHGLEDGSKKLL